MGRVFQYCLVIAATILFGIGFPQEFARSAALSKPGLVHHAMTIAQVGGASTGPPRLVYHPAHTLRVLPDQHAAGAQPVHGGREARAGAAGARQTAYRSPWLLSAGGALVLASLILRWQLPRRPVARAPNPRGEASSMTALEVLITNRLPIVEEPLLLRNESQIFGRPRLESQYRVDAPHALHGPHFAADSRGLEQARATTHATVRQPHVAWQDGNVRVDEGHPATGPGALDRALAALGERP